MYDMQLSYLIPLCHGLTSLCNLTAVHLGAGKHVIFLKNPVLYVKVRLCDFLVPKLFLFKTNFQCNTQFIDLSLITKL